MTSVFSDEGMRAAWLAQWASVEMLIEDNSTPEPNTGCRLWTGDLSKQGYGLIKRRPTAVMEMLSRLAHRVVVELRMGRPLPPSIQVHHICHQRCCVESAHLVPLTRAAHQGVHAGLLAVVRIPSTVGRLTADEIAAEVIQSGREDIGFYFGGGR
jgi:hypothetical protein